MKRLFTNRQRGLLQQAHQARQAAQLEQAGSPNPDKEDSLSSGASLPEESEVEERVSMVAYCLDTGYVHHWTMSTDGGLAMAKMIKWLSRRWTRRVRGMRPSTRLDADDEALMVRFVTVMTPLSGLLSDMYPHEIDKHDVPVFRLGLSGRAAVYCLRDHPVDTAIVCVKPPQVSVMGANRVEYFRCGAKHLLDMFCRYGAPRLSEREEEMRRRLAIEDPRPLPPRPPSPRPPRPDPPEPAHPACERVAVLAGTAAAALLDNEFVWARSALPPLPLPPLEMLEPYESQALEYAYKDHGRALFELSLRFREIELRRGEPVPGALAARVVEAVHIAVRYGRIAKALGELLCLVQTPDERETDYGPYADPNLATAVDLLHHMEWHAWYYGGFFAATAGDIVGADVMYAEAYRGMGRFHALTGELAMTFAVEGVYVTAQLATAWPRLEMYADHVKAGYHGRDMALRLRLEEIVTAAHTRAAANRAAGHARMLSLDRFAMVPRRRLRRQGNEESTPCPEIFTRFVEYAHHNPW